MAVKSPSRVRCTAAWIVSRCASRKPTTRLINNALTNGARYYVDHAHPEYATPECRSARDVIACDKAGERILERSRQRVNASLNGTHEIQVYKNNSDHKGNSYGCHENYTVEAHTYQELFRETGLRELIPFLVSRQIICGAGKIGQENSSGTHAGYQTLPTGRLLRNGVQHQNHVRPSPAEYAR